MCIPNSAVFQLLTMPRMLCDAKLSIYQQLFEIELCNREKYKRTNLFSNLYALVTILRFSFAINGLKWQLHFSVYGQHRIRKTLNYYSEGNT